MGVVWMGVVEGIGSVRVGREEEIVIILRKIRSRHHVLLPTLVLPTLFPTLVLPTLVFPTPCLPQPCGGRGRDGVPFAGKRGRRRVELCAGGTLMGQRQVVCT